MFEAVFKNIDNSLRKEVDSELDYAMQMSWLLFLKYLDDREPSRKDEATLEGREYQPVLDPRFAWSTWAAPKKADGNLDHKAAMTGEDLTEFVDRDLFPYLRGFRGDQYSPDTIQYKIGQIFGEVNNRIGDGYVMRSVINSMDQLTFGGSDAKHELSDLYETRIKNMGNAGRTGGQYYTPRPLIRAMISVVDPKIGETIYDAAVGSAGFLCEAYDYLRPKARTGTDRERLQHHTLYGQEKKTLPFVLGVMNLILHGVEAPNIIKTNTLAENVLDIQNKDRHDVILANPPFGSEEVIETIKPNFPIKSGETAYLFMQHFVRKLKPGGRAAVVIKNTFLSNTDNASVALRKQLLEETDLHTVLDCPGGTFPGTGVKTVVLFFTKGRPTRSIGYYQLDPGRTLGKTNPLTDADMEEFVRFAKTRETDDQSWIMDAATVDDATFDLSVKNPNTPEAEPLRAPEAIIHTMLARDAETRTLLEEVRALL